LTLGDLPARGHSRNKEMEDIEQGIKLPSPWGYFATLGWLIIAAAMGTICAVAVLRWLHPEALSEPQTLTAVMSDGPLLSYTTIISTVVLLTVLTLVAWLKHWPPFEYLGLMLPKARETAIALAALLVLLALTDTATSVLNKDIVSQFQTDIYNSADAAGALPLLWFTLIIVAPFGEEVTFRGFLYRGWVRTVRGVVPGVLLISVFWALIHVQYDWFGIIQVFSLGLFLGWARWWSGSTTLTFFLHAAANLWATVETLVKLQAAPG